MSLARTAAGAVVDHLEAAHAALLAAATRIEAHDPPAFDAGPVGRAIEAAAPLLYDAFDGRADPLAAVRSARAEVNAAREVAASRAGDDPGLRALVAALGAADDALAAAEHRILSVPPEPRQELPELLASEGVPRLHHVARRSIAWCLRLPPPPAAFVVAVPERVAAPTTPDELRDAVAELGRRAAARRGRSRQRSRAPEAPRLEREVPPGFDRDIPPAMPVQAYIAERAREWFEEVALIGTQRAPVLGDPWRAAAPLEARMLNAIDALASLGPAGVTAVVSVARDAPVKDERVGFAIAMTLGCLAGRDALGAAERLLAEHAAEPGFVRGFGAGLQIASHDHVGRALHHHAARGEATVAAMAVDVLGFREAAPADAMAAWARRSPAALEAALPYLAAARHGDVGPLAAAARESPDEGLARAGHAAAIVGAVPHAVGATSERTRGPGGVFLATLLAIAGDEDDAAWLLGQAERDPSPRWAAAVGWAGDGAAVPRLITLLEASDGERAFAIADALERITGAGLFEDRLLPDDEIAVDDPPDPMPGPPRPVPLSRLVGDARDAPPEPAGETLALPTIDAARWRVWLGEHAGAFAAGRRYRRGKPFAPEVVLGELDHGRATPGERRWMQVELVLRTGRHVRLDPRDLVPVQETALTAWAPVARAASSMPGRWSLPRRL